MVKDAIRHLSLALLLVGLTVTTSHVRVEAQQSGPVAIDPDDIGGVVTSAKGPEAGVWVIAATTDLPTPYYKIVVTDDRGRYLVPDLPKATYDVWVRGYGVVDSKPVRISPGQRTNLSAVVAPSPRAAAEYYPASYWYALMKLPPRSAFPMKPGQPQSLEEWIFHMKMGSILTHQIGNKATREIPEALGRFPSSKDAWDAWLRNPEAPASIARLGRDYGIPMFADWTDRIAAGEYPTEAPPRPQGIERNVVITMWDWSTPKGFIHDEISTDKRNPTVNANGPLYSVEQFSGDNLNVLDPNTHTASVIKVPTRDPLKVDPRRSKKPLTWGEEDVWVQEGDLHNPMMDEQGRIWMTFKFRDPRNQPAFCKAGSDHPSARLFPLDQNPRQVAYYDPKTKKFDHIDLCFMTHHLQFAEDANRTLWFSTLSSYWGWVNTRMWDETHDAAKSQGWAPLVVDTNGNGKRDEWVEPDQPLDPAKDWRIEGHAYGVAMNPVDGSIWMANTYGSPRKNDFVPGNIVRLVPGPNPPSSMLTEIYEPPFSTSAGKEKAYNPKGIDADRNGVIWVSFASSGHLASFDRRKCKGPLNGPKATGQQCPEGWTLHMSPGPTFNGMSRKDDSVNADYHYYNWVDQFNTLGLGANLPVTPGTNSDSMLALMPDGNWLTLRVPYPLGFYARGVDGRIDNPNTGWKGRGLWSTFATVYPWHIEGGKGTKPKALKFQVRPDPLAK